MQFKRFIKYKAYPYVKIYLKNKAYNKTPLVILGVGVSIIPGFDWFPYLAHFLFPEIENTGTYINIISILVSLALILFSLYWINRQMTQREKGLGFQSKVILKQFSIDSSEKNKTSLNPKDVSYVILDQRPKLSESKLTWIKNNLVKQKEAIGDYLYVVERWDQPKSQYEGLAHIPFVFLLGYQVSDKRNFIFSEWDEHKLKWNELPENGDYAKLQLVRDLNSDKYEATDVNILISLTAEIKKSQLKGSTTEHNDIYHLKLVKCKRHAIKCSTQLSEYKEQFRSLLDELYELYPKLTRVNVFISAQTSLVFNIGSSLTRNDKVVFIYNFESKNPINYPWSLKVHKETEVSKLSSYIEHQGGV
ncbi:SAVED domain-containing protein [Gracilibacillus sp. YIM 98692]|uniref:SAVED domain-containing protein n=1 Tax=Gracilibacillus sp. YIM 98692 TaxID=2663532 RepID=UPI0013D0BBAF|nr:SAVED domain-containing protein [Gracilibacillus sp. YIM 98692]